MRALRVDENRIVNLDMVDSAIFAPAIDSRADHLKLIIAGDCENPVEVTGQQAREIWEHLVELAEEHGKV